MNNIVSRVRRREAGFTLVELMVVVMIIAILMAIAIPTFLNSRKRAQDAAAKSNVRTGLSAAQAVYSEEQSYATATFLADLNDEEPSLDFEPGDTASAAPKTISVEVSTDGATIYLAAKSVSGKCYALRHSVASTDGGSSQKELPAVCTGAAAAAFAASTFTGL